MAILVVCLICGDFFQDSFQTTLHNMDFAFIFPLFLFPIVPIPSPLLVYSIRVLYMALDLLLRGLQSSLDIGVQIYGLVAFPCELRKS